MTIPESRQITDDGLTDAECRELVAEWDRWAEKEWRFSIPYSELWRRSKEAREHPETLVPHAEVMRRLREKTDV